MSICQPLTESPTCHTRTGSKAAHGPLPLRCLRFAGCWLVGAPHRDPGAMGRSALFAGRSLRGATVLVVCSANAPAIQHICQDQIAARMLMSGIRPVMVMTDLITAQGEQITDKIFAAARRAGANAIWAATIAPDVTVVSPGPTIGFGIGGFGTSGGWHRSSGVGGGIGVRVSGRRRPSQYGVCSGHDLDRRRNGTPDVDEQDHNARLTRYHRASDRADAGRSEICTAGGSPLNRSKAFVRKCG